MTTVHYGIDKLYKIICNLLSSANNNPIKIMSFEITKENFIQWISQDKETRFFERIPYLYKEGSASI